MDALELQAALVKLDPATTVTPIGSNVKLSHHRIAFDVDVVEDDLTLWNSSKVEEKQESGACSSEHQEDASMTTTATTSDATTTGTTITTGGGTTTGTRKVQNESCGASLVVPAHQNHQTGQQQQMGVSKCNLAEVR